MKKTIRTKGGRWEWKADPPKAPARKPEHKPGIKSGDLFLMFLLLIVLFVLVMSGYGLASEIAGVLP